MRNCVIQVFPLISKISGHFPLYDVFGLFTFSLVDCDYSFAKNESLCYCC